MGKGGLQTATPHSRESAHTNGDRDGKRARQKEKEGEGEEERGKMEHCLRVQRTENDRRARGAVWGEEQEQHWQTHDEVGEAAPTFCEGAWNSSARAMLRRCSLQPPTPFAQAESKRHCARGTLCASTKVGPPKGQRCQRCGEGGPPHPPRMVSRTRRALPAGAPAHRCTDGATLQMPGITAQRRSAIVANNSSSLPSSSPSSSSSSSAAFKTATHGFRTRCRTYWVNHSATRGRGHAQHSRAM